MKCRHCGKTFTPEGKGNYLFCSVRCRREYRIPKLRERHTPKIASIVTKLTVDEYILFSELTESKRMSKSGYIRMLIVRELESKAIDSD